MMILPHFSLSLSLRCSMATPRTARSVAALSRPRCFFVSCALVSLSLSVTGKKRRKTKRGQRRCCTANWCKVKQESQGIQMWNSREKVIHGCHSQSERRGCRRRWYLPQSSTIKRVNVVLAGRGLLRIGCRPAKSRICQVPMPRMQREMGRWGELTSKPPEQGG